MTPTVTGEVEVPLSKTKLALVLLGAVAFVTTSAWLWLIAYTQERFNPMLLRVVAVVGASFFGLVAISALRKIFDGRPGLIIDRDGIIDNSSGVAAGRIFWHEIVGLRVHEISGQRFLTIEVADSRRFEQRGGALRRWMNAANTRLTGSPINISSNALRMKFDELVELLSRAYETHRGPA